MKAQRRKKQIFFHHPPVFFIKKKKTATRTWLVQKREVSKTLHPIIPTTMRAFSLFFFFPLNTKQTNKTKQKKKPGEIVWRGTANAIRSKALKSRKITPPTHTHTRTFSPPLPQSHGLTLSPLFFCPLGCGGGEIKRGKEGAL